MRREVKERGENEEIDRKKNGEQRGSERTEREELRIKRKNNKIEDKRLWVRLRLKATE